MRTIFTILVLVLIPSIFGYSQSTDVQRLMKMGIYPIESIASEINYIDTNLIKYDSISLEDINVDFSNIQDLEWLKEIGNNSKAVLIGEDHFNTYIQNLRNRIFFALNTYDYFPVIILERPFTYTEFVNYYLQLEDDKEAELFYEKNLVRIVNTKEEYSLLQHTRRWNTNHPEKPVAVGYYDVEKTIDELSVTLNQILIPYFQKLDPQLNFDWEVVLSGNFEELIKELKFNLKKAVKANHIGQYPFITPKYISAVIDNLESSNYALYVDYMLYRQKALLRNITDTLYLGKYIQTGKIVIHSGSMHLRTKVESDSTNNLWEGSYLTHVYEPTLGKTYSLQIESIARSLGEAATINSSYVEPALGYSGLLKKMQDAFNDGLIDSDGCYFISIYNEVLNEYSKFWIQEGKKYKGQGLFIKSAHWDEILDLIQTNHPEKADSFVEQIGYNVLFDDVIIIPCSPIITPIAIPVQ